jgi:hypothetical protein
MQTKVSLLGAALLSGLAATTAHAALLCSSAGYTGPLSVSDMSFRGSDADDCYGLVIANDDGSNVWPVTGTETGWTLFAKDDVGGGLTTGVVNGIRFTLDALPDTQAKSGTWVLTWTKVGEPGYDLTMDIVAVLKGGNRFASYLFEQETFTGNPTTAAGTWQITYTNNGGQIPTLSHLSLYYRNATHSSTSSSGGGASTGNGVPEPGVLWLTAAGLLGLGWLRRQKAS